jgi:hypothetical protein
MAQTTIPIAQTVFPNGATQIIDQEVSGSSVAISMGRNTPASALQWANDSTEIQIDVQVSYDDGKTFQSGGSATAIGGSVIDPSTQAAATSTRVTFYYSQPITNVIITLTVTNGPCSTSGSVTVQ